MNDPKIYLAGPIRNVEDNGAPWRTDLIDSNPGVAWLNPLEQHDVPGDDLVVVDEGPTGPNEVTVEELVESDKQLVRESDAVLVGYRSVQMVGTPMEAMLAYELRTPVIVWIQDQTSVDEISPWLRHHAELFTGQRARAVDQCKLLADYAGRVKNDPAMLG